MTTAAPAKRKAYRGKPILTYHRGWYYFYAEQRDGDQARRAGFRWAPMPRGFWCTQEPVVAARLKQHADHIALTALDDTVKDARATLLASRATDADIDLPVPADLAYMPFQRAGIAYALGRTNTLIGDEPGLGKTIQAAGIINATPGIKSIVVVCPASLKINWRRELDRWLVVKRQVYTVDDWFPATDEGVFLINFERLHNFARIWSQRRFDLLIIDEAHRIKNTETRTARHAYSIQATKRVFLTGTPIVNRPMELWPLAHALAPHVFDNEESYRNRYGKVSVKTQAGKLALRELQTMARMSFMVRRLKKDVLTELPPKVRQVIELPPGSAATVVAAERNAAAEQHDLMERLRIAVELAKVEDDDAPYTEALEEMRKAGSMSQGHVSKVRHETALAKVPAVVDYVKELLTQVGKCVLFAHHKDVIAEFMRQLPDAVALTGDMSPDARQRSVDAFQKGSARVFVGSIMAAGVGLTLTAASHVVFAELDWVPGNMTQAEDRCHRIGQKDSVSVVHLVFEGSIDANIARTLVEKQAVIEAALDGKLNEDNSGDMLGQPIVPTVDETFATAHVSRDRLKRDALEMSPQECEDWMTTLATGEGLTPGRMHRIDVALVSELVAAPSWSPLRAAMARRIVRNYTPKETSE